MTIQKTLSEQRKANLVKALRSAIRLKHSLEADEELNEYLPAAEAAFDIALQSGTLPDEIDLHALIAGVVSGRELPSA